MANNSPKMKILKQNNCVVCEKAIFRFERRIKISDLSEQEKAACASLIKKPDASGGLQDKEDVLCTSCHRKLQGGGRDGVDSAQKANTERQDSPQKESSPRHRVKTETNPGHQHNNNADKELGSPINPSSSEILQQQEVVADQSEARSSGNGLVWKWKNSKINRSTASFVGHAVAVIGVMAMGVGFGGAWLVLAAGILMLLGIIFAKHQDVQPWIHLVTHSDGNGASGSSAKQKPRMDAAQAAAAGIIVGNSLAGTSTLTLLQDGYRVTCGIEVENWTQYALVQPFVQISRGTLTLAPSNVAPGTREVMVARKTSGLAEGSYGTVSWLIQPTGRRLVVMWCAPFNFNHHSNWLAVGLTDTGITEHSPGDDWFSQMYYKNSTEQLRFERGEYHDNIQPVFCRDDDFEVEGIMGSDHKAVVKVILRPLDPDYLAHCLKEKMMNS